MRYLRIFVILIILISSFFILQVVKDKETISNISELTTKGILDLSTMAATVLADLTITVDHSPIIFIDSPKNITYNYNNSIELNFTAIDDNLDTIYYNIDDGDNVTVTANTTFSVNLTSHHTLTLYANNTLGNLNSSSVTFSINISAPWNITFTEFTGGTTNFSALNKSQQADIKEAILENPEHGKIAFNEVVNISRDINLDLYGNISSNRIEIESEDISEFNKSALIYLYNITFTDPGPVRDGITCSSDICTEINFSNNIFVFNVTSFTVYSAEETASEAAPAAGAGGAGGGAGGGGAGVRISNFVIDKNIIKLSLLPGETKREFIEIENTGETTLILTIDLEGLEQFLIFPGGVSKYDLRLEPEESEQIQLTFNVDSEQESGVYPGKIIISSTGIKKIITTIVEVESPRRIFDISIRLTKSTVYAGDTLDAEINIFNLGNLVGRVDTQVEFGIKDLAGKIITKDETRLAVETKAIFVETVKIPSYLESDIYVFYAIVTFDGEKGTTSEVFEIIPKPKEILDLSLIYIYIIGGFVLIIIFAYLKNLYKKKKFDINKLLREAKKGHASHKKIHESQLKILKQDYRLGLINKEEYLRRKRKL